MAWRPRPRWGGDCQPDIALAARRAGRVGRGRVGSDPTVSRTVDALAKDADRVLGAIYGAGAVAPARVWRLAGRDAPTTTPKCDGSVQVIREITGLPLTAARGRRTAPKATVWCGSRIASRRRRRSRS